MYLCALLLTQPWQAGDLVLYLLKTPQLKGLPTDSAETYVPTLAIGHLLANGLISPRQSAVLAAMLAITRFEHFDVNTLHDSALPPIRIASVDLFALYIGCVNLVCHVLSFHRRISRMLHADYRVAGADLAQEGV